MEIRKMGAVRCLTWIKQGYQLIMRNPLLSITLALIGMLLMFALIKVPVFGPLLAILAMPVLVAGYARVCRALEENEEVELAHLFEGFQKHTGRLVALGGLTLLWLFGASIIMMLIGGEALTTLLDSLQTTNDPQVLMEAMWSAGSGVALSLLVSLALMAVLMLSLQYAPMLVFFNEATPFAAMRASLAGTLRNFVPYVCYNIIMQLVAAVLSLLPFGLGLVLLMPLGFTSLFVSYRNIFPFAHELTAPEPITENPEV